MGIEVTTNYVHWNYLIALEQDVERIARFIEFTDRNFETYSIELAHLLLAASSETDVVLKALCNLKDPDKNHRNINDYRETVKINFNTLISEKCYMHRYGLTLEPWTNWGGDTNPAWWHSYNNVKHERNQYFHEANLHNTLNSICGLAIVVLYYYHELFSQVNQGQDIKDTTSVLLPSLSLIEYNQDYSFDNLVA